MGEDVDGQLGKGEWEKMGELSWAALLGLPVLPDAVSGSGEEH